MRVPAISLILALTATSSASADERLLVRAELDARVSAGELSFAEQAGEESRGNDLGRLHAGFIGAIGIDTGDVSIAVDGGLYKGGLAAEDVASRYFVAPAETPSTLTFTVGAAARYRRPTTRRLTVVGSLRLGYSRMMLRGSQSASLSSLYMEVGGGGSLPLSLGSLDARVDLIAGLRAHRPRSFAVSGLTDGSLNTDTPDLFYAPGLTASIDLLF